MAKQVTRSRRMSIKAPPEKVFPLLCPVREHDYLEEWRATVLHSDSGFAERGCIFETPGQSFWYIGEHDPELGRIVFVIFTSNSRLSRLDVELTPLAVAVQLLSSLTPTQPFPRKGKPF